MEKVNNTIRIYTQVITFLLIWTGVILLSSTYTPMDLMKALWKIPLAVTLYIIVCGLFTRWLWRMPPFQGWLIKLPDLQGTWKGELKSDWINPKTGEGIAPIPVMLVIRQTYNSIHCTLMTAESSSYSTASGINNCFGEGDLYLTYNYTNRPRATLRHRSEIHDGASILRIIKTPKLHLEGEYWTSRKTRGDMTFNFESKKIAEEFCM